MKKTKNDVDKKIINYVESFFEEIYYSKEIESAKNKIIYKLNDEYLKEKEKDKKAAFKNIVKKYNCIEKMLTLVNISSNKLDEWYKKDISLDFDEFKKELKKEKKHIYATTILGIVTIVYFLQSILYFRESFLTYFLSSLFFLIIDIFVIRKYRKQIKKDLFSVDYYDELKSLFDKYYKRSINWLLILFLELLMMLLNFISLKINSKPYEIIESFNNILLTLEICAFFFIKNTLIIKWLNKKIDYENEKKYIKLFKFSTIISSIYFILSIALFFIFEKYFVLNITAFIGILFLLFIILLNFTKIKNIAYHKKKTNKIIIATIFIIILLFGGYTYLSRDIWLTQPYINSIPHIYEGNDKISYNDETGVYTIISNEDDFKILQLTDVHLGGSVLSYDKDMKALKAVYELIDYSKPDLVVVTGDLTFPMGIMSFSFNNTAPVQQFAAFMRNTGVPWVFTYGNHDTESMAKTGKEDLNELYKSLSWKTSKNLLYPYIQPTFNNKNIWGRNNQLIEVRNSDGTLNQALFMIDSNAYTGEGLNKYDYIHDNQVNWYKEQVLKLNKEEEKIISSLVFFHIPLQEYKTAYDLYEKGNNKVKYFFGSNDEKMINKICASDYPSNMFPVAKELGSTKGFFCGHDHYNNMSLEYEGIRLTYGMSIDYLVMPGIARDTKQRGATLITSHKDSTIDIEQIPLTSIEKYYK